MMAARSDVQWERLFVTEGITAREDLISSGQTPHTPFPLHVQAKAKSNSTRLAPFKSNFLADKLAEQISQPLVRLHHTHRYCTQYSDPSSAASLDMKPGSTQPGSSNLQMQRSYLHHHHHPVPEK
jgi:hypothetical protein